MRHAKYRAPRPDEIALDDANTKMRELLYRFADGDPRVMQGELRDAVRDYRKAMATSVDKDLELEGFPPFEAVHPGSMETRVSMDEPESAPVHDTPPPLDGVPPEFKATNFAAPPRQSEPPPPV